MVYSIYINGKYCGFTEDDDIEAYAKSCYPLSTYEVKEDKLFLKLKDIS